MDDNANLPTPPASSNSEGPGSEYIRVEVDRMESGRGSGTGQGASPFPMLKPPIWSTWICLFLAWLFLGSPIPFTVFIGLPINLAALILAVVSLTRGGVKTGILVLILGTVGSFIVYLMGLFQFIGGAAVH